MVFFTNAIYKFMFGSFLWALEVCDICQYVNLFRKLATIGVCIDRIFCFVYKVNVLIKNYEDFSYTQK